MILFLLFIPFAISIYLWTWFNYAHLRSPSFCGAVRLKYKDLASFYRVNPKRWGYAKIADEEWLFATTDWRVLLFNAGDSWAKSKKYTNIYVEREKITRIQLSYIDYLKFQYARVTRRTKKGKDSLLLLLATVQDDIKDLRALSNSEIEDGTEKIKALLEEKGEARQ